MLWALSYEERCMIGTPNADDNEKRMNDNAMIGHNTCSLANEWKTFMRVKK